MEKKGQILINIMILLVKDLMVKTNRRIKFIVGQAYRYLPKIPDKMVRFSYTCREGVLHVIIHYRKYPSPYLQKYGKDEWHNVISNCVFMKKYECGRIGAKNTRS